MTIEVPVTSITWSQKNVGDSLDLVVDPIRRHHALLSGSMPPEVIQLLMTIAAVLAMVLYSGFKIRPKGSSGRS